MKVKYIKEELFTNYMTGEKEEKGDSDRFFCPFCEEESQHERVETGGDVRWKCQNCGVTHV